MFSGEEERWETEKRERAGREYGPEPRHSGAQSTRSKNANRPPSHPVNFHEKNESRGRSKTVKHLKRF